MSRPAATAGVQTLQTAVSTCATYMAQLPDTAVASKTWGPKEVLTHLVFWLETTARLAQAQQAGDRLPLPEGRFHDLNARAVADGRSLSVTALLARHQRACQALCTLAREQDQDAVSFPLKAGGAARPLSWYLAAEADHIQHHLRKLQAQAAWQPAQAAAELRQTAVAFIDRLATLPAPPPSWGPREMLAHLVFWLERDVAQIEAQIAGRPHTPPRGRTDTLNAQAVVATAALAISELRRRFDTAVDKLAHFAQTCDPQNIIVEMRLPHDRRTLDDAIIKTTVHIAAHHRQLRRQGEGDGQRGRGGTGSRRSLP